MSRIGVIPVINLDLNPLAWPIFHCSHVSCMSIIVKVWKSTDLFLKFVLKTVSFSVDFGNTSFVYIELSM